MPFESCIYLFTLAESWKQDFFCPFTSGSKSCCVVYICAGQLNEQTFETDRQTDAPDLHP